MRNFQGAELQAHRPRLLSVNEACATLGLGRTSVYAAMASGHLQSVTVGRRRLVPDDAIEQFIAQLPTQYRRRVVR